MMTKGGSNQGALFLPPTTSPHHPPFLATALCSTLGAHVFRSHLHQQQQSLGVRRLGRMEVQEEERGEGFGEEAQETQKVLTSSSSEEESTRAGATLAQVGRLPRS